MIKVICSTEDILNECLVRADMKWFEVPVIVNMQRKILEDWFCLKRYSKKDLFPGTVFMCEWNENWVRDSDDWVRSPTKFLYAVAQNYIEDAMRLVVSMQ